MPGDARLILRPERRRGKLAVPIGEGERGEPAAGGVAVLDLHDEESILHAIAHRQVPEIGGCGQLHHDSSGCFTSAFGCSLST